MGGKVDDGRDRLSIRLLDAHYRQLAFDRFRIEFRVAITVEPGEAG